MIDLRRRYLAALPLLPGRALAAPAPVAMVGVSALGAGLVLLEPALWGFVGTLIYGSFDLTAKLWGGNPALENARKLAIARFFIGLVLGTSAAQELSLPVQQMAGASAWASSGRGRLGLGLFSLYLYPIIAAALGSRLKAKIEGPAV